MEVSFQVDKIIIFTLCNTVLFTSGGVVNEVLARLQLIDPTFKYGNLIYISFNAKYRQTFWET